MTACLTRTGSAASKPVDSTRSSARRVAIKLCHACADGDRTTASKTNSHKDPYVRLKWIRPFHPSTELESCGDAVAFT